MPDDQYELYGGLPPYVRDSSTSLRSALEVLKTCGDKQRLVYSLLRAAGPRGMTDDQLERATGLKHQSVSARRRELVLKGLVVASDLERLSESGRSVTVWIAKGRG